MSKKQDRVNERQTSSELVERVRSGIKKGIVDYDNHPIHANFPLDGNYKQIDAEKNKNAGLLASLSILDEIKKG